ncbi:MAG TPA: heparan-alpha-glucosaminide N-acetyltransferase domain-containing protein [Bryobacteraceae bacterium]|nr:heparan-alpha-glucosaminide N-acetyltransferase domain-containing protein [Bryobacteraceae bacterium]
MIEQVSVAKPPPPREKGRSARLPFLDWTRGMAAAIMLQGHVFHSFARNDQREQGPYIISQFIGGIAPAIFLFLTGVTLAFLMHGLEKKGLDGKKRILTSLRRAGYLAILAFAFRFQLFLFGWPQSPWGDLFKVDILNSMALAIAVCSLTAAFTTAERSRMGVVIGLSIAAAAPLISLMNVSSWPETVQAYLVPDARYFSFFPWASFVAFGVSAGSILRLVTEEQLHRIMQWASIVGFGLIISAQYFSNLPYSLYPATDFWLNSPGLIFIKLGVILVLLAFTFLWTHHGAGEGWSWVRQLGTTSLLVYWVHIELVYGRWFGFWKEQLTLAQCAVAAAVLTLLMIALSVVRTYWRPGKASKWLSVRGNIQGVPASRAGGSAS